MSERICQVEKPPKRHIALRLLKCCVIALIVAALPIAGVFYFNVYLPQGKGPAGPNVPAEPFSRIWSDKKVVLLGIGDSITDGVSARKGFSYFERLVKNPAGDSPDMLSKNLSAVFPNLTATNIASLMTTSIQHLVALEWLRRRTEDVLGIVVMTTGNDDIMHSYGQHPPIEGAMYGATVEQALPWLDNFQQRLDEIVMQLMHIFPGGCHIFLANIYDPTDGTGNTSEWLTGLPAWPECVAIRDSYNLSIKKCAEKFDNVHLVDIHTLFLGHGMHCRKFWTKNYRRNDPTCWYQSNVQDPSERGYDAIRRAFLLEMIKVFDKPQSAE
jgi:hypothetical protein